jgi:threonine/homoserine/homoserine lactone efflux protein
VNHYLGFVAISIAVLVFPGPSILLIIANSLQRGRWVGLFTVAGGLVAMGVQRTTRSVGTQLWFGRGRGLYRRTHEPGHHAVFRGVLSTVFE